MKKLLIATLLLPSLAHAGLITHTDYTAGNTITASGQNSNENTIVNEFNGNIDNTNIKSGAAVAVNKLAAMSANKLTITDGSGFISTTDNSVTSNSTFTITGGLSYKGVVDGSTAPVGNFGEYVSSTQVGGVYQYATSTYGDVLNIVLTAGDWDVTGIAEFARGSNATLDSGIVLVSTTTGNSAVGTTQGVNGASYNFNTNSGATLATYNIPSVRFNFTATTTVYLKIFAVWGGSNPPNISGARISARRMR